MGRVLGLQCMLPMLYVCLRSIWTFGLPVQGAVDHQMAEQSAQRRGVGSVSTTSGQRSRFADRQKPKAAKTKSRRRWRDPL